MVETLLGIIVPGGRAFVRSLIGDVCVFRWSCAMIGSSDIGWFVGLMVDLFDVLSLGFSGFGVLLWGCLVWCYAGFSLRLGFMFMASSGTCLVVGYVY